MKIVVVTGASGFIGANLSRRLARRGAELHLLLRPQSQMWRLEGFDAFHRHDIDIADGAALADLFARIRPTAVTHLAAYGAYSSQTDVGSAVRTNLESAITLMESAKGAGVTRFINTGSSSEYGYKNHAPDEFEALSPNSLYAVTKSAATYYGRYLAASAGFHVTTLRLYSVYGRYEEPTRLIPTLVVRGIAGKLPPLVAPSTARDYIYVDDVLDAYERVLEADIRPGSVFNIGTGRQTALSEVVEVARNRLRIPEAAQWGSMPRKGWDTDTWVANTQRIEAETGWRATTNFADGFDRTARWLTESESRLAFYATFGTPLR